MEMRAIAFIVRGRMSDDDLREAFARGFDEECVSGKLEKIGVRVFKETIAAGKHQIEAVPPLLDALEAVGARDHYLWWLRDCVPMDESEERGTDWNFATTMLTGGSARTMDEFRSQCFPTWERDFRPLVDRKISIGNNETTI